MHQLEARRVLRFVPLEMADEVPPDRGMNDIHLGERLLNPVFTDVPEPCFEPGLYGFRAMGLRHGNDRDALSMTSPLNRRVDFRPDLPQSLRQVRKWHNAPSYRRVVPGDRGKKLCRGGVAGRERGGEGGEGSGGPPPPLASPWTH